MSNQMIVDFARKHIKELQRELKVWKNVERDYKCSVRNEKNLRNAYNAYSPKKPRKYTGFEAILP